jgi:hypothetical protein
MIIAPLVSLASGFLDSLIPANAPAKPTASSSPFAQLLSSLEQIEQKQISDFTNTARSLNL